MSRSNFDLKKKVTFAKKLDKYQLLRYNEM